jgi:Flp pilus assembly protein TadB
MNPISVTHPATAWLVTVLPAALSAAAFLIMGGILWRPLRQLLAQIQQRKAQQRSAQPPHQQRPDLALLYLPTGEHTTHLLSMSAGVGALTAASIGLFAPTWIALIAASAITLLIAWMGMQHALRRATSTLDRDLTAAVGRLSALLRSGSGFRPALERVLADLPDGPLRDEWSFLLTRQGVPLQQGGIATPQHVVSALASQTTSSRHATLLNHLSVAVGQPQDVLARRCTAAYEALQASDRRRDEALTELAQMRYSGLAVGMAGIFMALYLVFTQWERMLIAYSSSLGVVIAVIVICALLLPIGGGLLLSQVHDMDY